ncbi:hypothetical protein C8R45DRAFT_1014895 [Mycena sanguinolenta]|nr:hypothetical protein C8R45DRAFT_1014895 [Mycena sanguinolenta]
MFRTISRPWILFLVLASVLTFLIYLEGGGYTNWSSLHPPAVPPRPAADLPSSAPLSEILFPSGPRDEDHSWIAENARTIASLFRCVEQGSCTQNQTKVVILTSGPFTGDLKGDTTGETIWAHSTLIALRRLGYSFLYATTMERGSQLYHMFRHLVVAIVADIRPIHACFRDENCVRMEHKPHGIPAWTLLSFHFWDSAENPLGRKWTLSPEPWREFGGNTYLGYSIEQQCALHTFIPSPLRPAQAFVYAKNAAYFNGSDHPWAAEFFDAASAAAKVEFIAGVQEEVLPEFFPSSITTVGILPQAQFYTTLSNSRVLVGVGRPATSPTPYDALCLGVPFINPILDWDRNAPKNKTRWYSQHNTLKYLDPPYVYNVFRGDKEGFVNAVVEATSTPIESFVLPSMRMSAVEARLGAILATDWKKEAAALLAERKKSGVGKTFWLG